MTNAEILFASIAEVGALYRAGQVSPVEVTELSLKQIERLDPKLKAFITVTAERAMDTARQAEQELRAGRDRGALHGIPVALKDLIDTAGVRTTAGSRVLANHVPSRDAFIVERLKAAGAVIVGKTTLQEFAYGVPHPDYGQTRNPWDLAHTAGGSSGGSAAAVVAGLCYAAVGTDTGGSIRVPAAYCGAAGLKPTYGLVSLDGVFPLSWSLDHAGPMARTSMDAALLLGVLADGQPASFQPASLRGLRLGVLTEHRTGPELQPAVREAFEKACDLLGQAGVDLRDVTIPDLNFADGTLLTIVAPEASVAHTRWIKERPEDYAPLTRTQIELGFTIPAVSYVRLQQFRRHLTAQLMAALKQVDALLSPTTPWVAPDEDPAILGDEGVYEGRRTVPYNLTGLPAHSLPCGFSPAGLPIGLQIATRPGADALALGIGAACERLFAVSHRIPSLALL
jgi:aspartyl-tRNA(Asn)/glutamyl-tRNA(Gln) amidotransferase subunit A